MMRRLFTLLLLTLGALCARAGAVDDLLRRVLPYGSDASRFHCSVIPGGAGEGERFTVASDGRRVRVTGTTTVAVAAGVNWFLQRYAGVDISWNCPVGRLPRRLPVVAGETRRAGVDFRYYLNFCTHSYSMAFWDWARWEREIDWMALHGVNLPLVITGQECVWRDVLVRGYGYADTARADAFVAGAAYYGWFFMNNLTGWGGPQSGAWYESRRELARRIFRRMAELGMDPVVPGYVGMVPGDFLAQADGARVREWRAVDIVPGGRWNSFERPAFVNDTLRLREFAAEYYAAFDRLYGDVCRPRFFAIDPFHEGGVPSGVTDAAASVRAMYAALLHHEPGAVWVCQHWQDNPTPIVTHSVPRGRLLILDLHGDNRGDTVCGGHSTAADGAPHRWVWGQVSNFGGNVGLFGRMDRLISCFYKARAGAGKNGLAGIGALPEGIGNNEVLYDLLYALPWTEVGEYSREGWLRDYIYIRYGVRRGTRAWRALEAAWQRLGRGIYNCPNDGQQGTTESVFLMRPSLVPGTVSSWAGSTWYWDFADVRAALGGMLSVADGLRGCDNFRYDLVDVMRQAMADLGKLTLDSLRTAATEAERGRLEDRFLRLILDQDRLLGTRREFRLGTWTEQARSLGTTAAEADLYERNARMLLTTWGGRAQCEAGGLHDYANREWQGLLAAYYYPRWHAFFSRGCREQAWFEEYEWPFATGAPVPRSDLPPGATDPAYGTFRAAPQGDEIALVRELCARYLPGLRE
ncbi:MAG: alpha-N-acetylglucosaminidase [Alloprevotella sp.]|nr:alpha-N-acetylglucosaminidase [Alloprevotella sp.]